MAGIIPEKHSSRTDFIRPGVILGTDPVADFLEDTIFLLLLCAGGVGSVL